jgi:glutathione S-transferase
MRRDPPQYRRWRNISDGFAWRPTVQARHSALAPERSWTFCVEVIKIAGAKTLREVSSMLTLYYSPGACSMASHITLEETSAKYEAVPILLAKGENKTESYLKINPRGKVPALSVDKDVITENTAILTHLAKSFPEKNLMPKDPLGEARCISTMAWLSNTVHPCFSHIFRPERFSADESAHPGIKEVGKQSFFANLQEIDGLLAGKQWLQGAQFTTCDPYALVFYSWGNRIELPMKDLKNYTAWKDRMVKRPAVHKVLEREKNPLLQAA